MQSTPLISEAGPSAGVTRLASAGQGIRLAQSPALGPSPEQRPAVGRNAPLTRLPAELLRRIAAELPDSSRIALSEAAPNVIGQRIHAEVDLAHVALATSSVNTLADFHALLGGPGTRVGDGSRTLRSLLLSLRAERLVALGLRIHALPPPDRPGAIAAFRSEIAALGANHTTDRLAELNRVAGHATAADAARKGENVRSVAEFHGLTHPADIYPLERIAIDTSAGNTVRGGANVQVVARQHGVATPAGLRDLQLIAVDRDAPAGRAVRAGENVMVVAERHGVTAYGGIVALEEIAITSDEPGSAGSAVRAGKDVRRVAERHGITTEAGMLRLRQVASSPTVHPA